MPVGDLAKVSSLEALERFRSSLIIFLNKANNSVSQISDEIRRTRGWVQNDQMLHWEGEIRRRKKVLEQAQQEMFSARISALRDDGYSHKAAVRKAQLALDEAEEKLRKVKQWSRDYDTRLYPLSKKLETLRQFLEGEMPKAITRLSQTQKTLESYTERTSASSLPPPASDIPDETAPPDGTLP